MRALTIATTLLAFAAAANAESPFAGTWKLNRARTEFSADGGILKIEAEGSGIRVGGPGSAFYSGPLDGTERPGLGFAAKDTFALTKSGDRGFQAVQSRNGKPVFREVLEVSPDGNTLTRSFTFLGPRKDGKQPTKSPPSTGPAVTESRILSSVPGTWTVSLPSGEKSLYR